MLGYDKNIFILPFDHGVFLIKGLLGDKAELSQEDRAFVKDQKRIIFDGFKKAIDLGVPKEDAAILIDEQFGKEIFEEAKASGITTLLTMEKSGTDEFEFGYADFESHLLALRPDFAKTKINFSKNESNELKLKRNEKLKRLSSFCQANQIKLLIEILVNKTDQTPLWELQKTAILEFQDNQVESDIWKLEGLPISNEYKEVIEIVKRNGREKVGIVILGGGETKESVAETLRVGAGVEGVIGFAIGRTIFWPALLKLKENQINREDAVNEIAKNFLFFYQVFTQK